MNGDGRHQKRKIPGSRRNITSIFWPIPDLNQRAFDSSDFSAEGEGGGDEKERLNFCVRGSPPRGCAKDEGVQEKRDSEEKT